MRRRIHGLLFLVLVTATLMAATSFSARAQARPRAVYVSVLDNAGNPVENLGAADFAVREDRMTREITSVTKASEPLQIALLVDNSQMSEGFIRDYREGVAAFINAVAADSPSGGKHQMALITLASRPTIASDYTTDTAKLLKAGNSLFAMPGTGAYLLDGILETSQGITKRTAPRATIVAITTEGPDLSVKNYEAVLEPLKTAGASLNVVVVGQPSNLEHNRAVVIDQGTKNSGGRLDTVLTSTALGATMKRVAARLTHQYLVTYARPDTLIPPEQVVVTTTKAGVTAQVTSVKDERPRR
jgi:hypothetical protein